ncbi:hypothetical protein [Gracilimonas mengyeensis]|uniref:Opacity protein n=1 Tax=Gracilimonas mengyeensis TaxID=1302730 RepID=A0A521FN41_9BACT|nr:hypothetical protein [Gracilimonas mengyeensis]SMO96990.1 Opacity protein [Gracilimonas mengyeensis]
MQHIVKISVFAVTLLLSLATSISTFAQSNSDDTHAPAPGDKALQFQITDNFTLGSFEGSALSLQNQVTEKRAHRIGVSISNLLNDLNSEYQNSESEDKRTNSRAEFSFTWKNYITTDNPIKAYYGIGPEFSYFYEKNKDKNESQNQLETQRYYNIGLGVLGYFGVEWFFHPSISMHAEYRGSVSGYYQHRKMKQKDLISTTETTTDKQYGKGISFGGNGVAFGLSVYF